MANKSHPSREQADISLLRVTPSGDEGDSVPLPAFEAQPGLRLVGMGKDAVKGSLLSSFRSTRSY